MKFQIFTLLLVFAFITGFANQPAVNIPLGGNAYVTQKAGNVEISKSGLRNWDNKDAVISSWFKVSQGGELNLAIKAKVPEGTSEILVTIDGKKYPVIIDNPSWETIKVGSIKVKENQHVRVDFKGQSRTGSVFAEISDIIIDGAAAEEPLIFVREPENFYFGRRGPSVHLSYQIPETAGNVEYFYNEVTVPKGEDVIGSYYMVNGFGEGYCGIQANSPDERRILFSVWSPYKTDNPEEIPEDAEVHLLGKGKDVVTKEFGGEGSGGQSFLRYPWKAGQTYRFLTRIHPDQNREGATVYTSWFFDPNQNDWRLIASFSRPQKVTWYTRPHSFLENFIPSQGHLTREVEFANQWIVTEKGEWMELDEAKFTYDATANAKRRADCSGGLTKNKQSFFLKNCGFFNENVEKGTIFEREQSKKDHPAIDFDALPIQ
ncbi:DUF3472 domain-containing protein [Maribellus sediminis]|uniref:DUF3472 domain-containing protein n=1 Tax=Maribellus sediminis TaxID=2696285 RepID=UPI00142FB8F7|nr:DUF3472 domain-containing protein [Maribellus sediminis]